MGGAVVSFLTMALAGRELSASLSTFQILCFRGVVGLVIVGALAWRGGGSMLRTARPGLHLARNVAHLGGQFGWFFAIAAIPLASVFAIEFTTPLWTALLAAALLAERLSARRGLAIVLGLAGVAMILRPGAGLLHPAAFAALGGAIAFALSYLATKRLTASDTPLTILFYMTVMQLPLATLGAVWQWQPPDWSPCCGAIGGTRPCPWRSSAGSAWRSACSSRSCSSPRRAPRSPSGRGRGRPPCSSAWP